ncbi:DUF6084 family protein [Edaphobacter aggregans]|uniref:DUF6084 family protein n=1 Tax=Edaphobacter aggregans TaxID=570835 RepID=UPI0005503229|nr:DUF6084 family protein [Edaphobacter aggregans]
MPDLSFKVEEAVVVPYAAAPTLAFRLRIESARAAERIHSVVLRCQIQIDVTRRRYTEAEQRRMRDLFGEPERWSQTLRSLLWTHANVVVPGFQGSTLVELMVPCTFDFNVAATKYFEGLTEGEIPLHLMFSGMVFYAGTDDVLQVAPISWEQETKFRLPVKVWREMMDAYYPNSAWLNLRRDVFERLYQYKTQRGIPTWEQVLEEMLPVEDVVRR